MDLNINFTIVSDRNTYIDYHNDVNADTHTNSNSSTNCNTGTNAINDALIGNNLTKTSPQ